MSRNECTGAEQKTKAATREFREGYDRIFGDKKPVRGRFIQDPATGKLIPASEYRAPEKSKLLVHVDSFDAYESDASGKLIRNRKERNDDLKATGCRDYEGKESELKEAARYREEKRRKLVSNMEETVMRTYYEIEHGYRRPRE